MEKGNFRMEKKGKIVMKKIQFGQAMSKKNLKNTLFNTKLWKKK